MGNDVFSYTNRDYEGSRQEGLAKIPIISNGVWTDLNPTDPGIIVLDYVHALVDMINYYQDHQALETFITTAKERANIFRIAKQLSYRINSASCAKVSVTYRSNFKYNTPIKIPKNTRVYTKDNITYLTTEDAYLKAGDTEVDVVCIQGKMYTKTYNGTGLSRFSAVEPPMNVNQTIALTAQNIDINTISIKDNFGREWTPVDFLVFSGESDRVFEADLNPDNSVIIRFGDGQRGMVPKETEVLTVTYMVTDAENGRVVANSIIYSDTIYNSQGESVEFFVSNKESSIGGASADSSTTIRELAPGAIKAQNRAVTLSDFENLARMVPGVANARAYDINTNSDIPFHEVRVLIIPEEEDNQLLLTEVYNYLYQRMIPPTNLQVLYPSAIEINLNITVKKLGDINDIALAVKVEEAIKKYFKTKSAEIGEDFYPTDLATNIASLPEVRYVVNITPSSAVEIRDLAVAKLGKLTINVQ